jgi:hypothetical protein
MSKNDFQDSAYWILLFKKADRMVAEKSQYMFQDIISETKTRLSGLHVTTKAKRVSYNNYLTSVLNNAGQ